LKSAKGSQQTEQSHLIAKMDKGGLIGDGPKRFFGNCGGDISGKQVGYYTACS
jgi:hypothetical protein